MKILITGASGWLGRNTIKYFLSKNIPLSDLILIGSKHRIEQIEKNMEVNIVTFSDIQKYIKNESIDGIIHLAYLTRDHSGLNLDSYIKTNIELTSTIEKILQVHKPKWMVYVSSGAIYSNYSSEIIEQDIVSNPYGFLKYKDEVKFRDLCNEFGINLTIGRLWGATGNDFIHAKKYAIGEFIINALISRNIFIKSNFNVFRTYCDSEQFIQICIESAIKNKFTLFDSNGEIIEVQELAIRIKNLLQPKIEIIREKLDSNLYVDDYYARNNTFFSLANDLQIKLLSLDEQIFKTSGYIKKNLDLFTN